MAAYFSTRAVPNNVWLGASVENQRHGLPRIPILRTIAAKTRFLSIEPRRFGSKPVASPEAMRQSIDWAAILMWVWLAAIVWLAITILWAIALA